MAGMNECARTQIERQAHTGKHGAHTQNPSDTNGHWSPWNDGCMNNNVNMHNIIHKVLVLFYTLIKY